jgi:hypothetical protein
MIFYLYDPKEKLHTFFTNSLAYELQKQHKKVIILNEVYNEEVYKNVKDEDYFIYIIHPIYLFKDLDVLRTVEELKKKRTKKILYVTEPLTLMMDRKNYRMLIHRMNLFELWTYTSMNLTFLNGYRINRIAPFFSKEYEWVLRDEKERNLDKIVFIGNPTKSRMDILEKFGEKMEIKSDGLWEREDWKRILKKNILFMNIHRIPKCPCLETMRIAPLLSNGGFIISENVNQKEMDEYKEMNIIFGKREELYDIYLRVLQDWNWELYYQRWELYKNVFKFENQWREIKWFNYKENE